jgi:hypothetical protein
MRGGINMASLVLRRIEPDFWTRVQTKARAEGLAVKVLILKLLARRLGVLVLLLAIPTLGAAQSLKIPAVILAVAGTADLASTAHFLTNGSGLREINPAVNWIKNPALMLTFGTAVESTIVTLLTRKLATRHPKWAATGLYLAAGIHAYYTIHNVRMMQKYPGR